MWALLLATAVAGEDGRILLWTVERRGARSWLFGTCHAPIPLEEALPGSAARALTGARVVYTETDLTRLSAIDLLRLTWHRVPPLSQRLPRDDWRRALLAAPAMPAPMIEHMPLVLTTSVRPSAGAPVSTLPILDLQVEGAAADAGIEVAHLETIDEALLAMVDADAGFLIESRRPGGDGLDIEALCYTGQTDGLGPRIDALAWGPPMLTARNLRWLDAIRPELADGGVFVAAGAAHMLGEHGLVALLRAEGFTVTRHRARLKVSASPPLVDRVPPDASPLPPEPDVPRWMALLEPSLDPLCAPGGRLMTCVAISPDACRATTHAAAELCIQQHARALEGRASLTPELQRELSVCGLSGLIIDAFVGDAIIDVPACKPIRDILDAMRAPLPAR